MIFGGISKKAAEDLYREFCGFVIFILAMFLLVGCGRRFIFH